MKNIVVIEKNGFLTVKSEYHILDTDEVLFNGEEEKCQNLIHPKCEKREENIHINFNTK